MSIWGVPKGQSLEISYVKKLIFSFLHVTEEETTVIVPRIIFPNASTFSQATIAASRTAQSGWVWAALATVALSYMWPPFSTFSASSLLYLHHIDDDNSICKDLESEFL